MSKIIVSNCWSFYNKGDAAIAIATVNTIQKIVPDAKITLLAVDDQSFIDHRDAFTGQIEILPMVHVLSPFRQIFFLYSILSYPGNGVTSFLGIFYLLVQLLFFPVIRKINPKFNRILSEIKSADLIVAVGGNYLYSNRSLFNHILILVYCKFVKKKKILLLGHSIGPFNDKISKSIAKKFLNYMDFIVFREEISKNYVYKNITNEISSNISGDAAFLLNDHNIIKLQTKNKKLKIGISIRRWFHRDPILFRKYLDNIKNITISLIKRNYHVYLIPFSYIEGSEDDIGLCKLFYSELPEKIQEHVTLLNLKELNPSEIISYLIDLEIDAFIATRLHSAILAALSNIPSLIISYQHFKAHGISRQLGLESYVINIGETDSDVLLKNLFDILQKSRFLKEKLNKSTKKIRKNTLNSYSSVIDRLIEKRITNRLITGFNND